MAIGAGCLIVAVPIVGIIAAIAIPNLLSAIQRGKQKRAMGEVRSIATSVQAYSMDYMTFPEEGYLNLVSPDYISVLPAQDSWETPSTTVGWTKRAIPTSRSSRAASDKMADDGMGGAYQGLGETTNCFESDIVWQDENFAVMPEGKQRKCQ